MGYESLGKLVDRWMTDAAFRQAMKRDPKEAAKAVGVTLSPEEIEIVRTADWSLSDQELQNRITKLFG